MIKRFLIFMLKLYQKYISPLKRKSSCRFVPTCSQYAIEAVDEWGAVVGLALTVWRLLRCNPFCRGGFDYVPKRKNKDTDSKN